MISEFGVVIGKLKSGERTFDINSSDSETLFRLEQQELVEKTFDVKYNDETKLNILMIEA